VTRLRELANIQYSLFNIHSMFVRKIAVEYVAEGRRQPCSLKWLDNFAMRNFTNDPVFDDTLPVADGLMEIGTHVPLDRLQAAMQDWFRRKSYLPKNAALVVTERVPHSPSPVSR
jgi:hypothetical protein